MNLHYCKNLWAVGVINTSFCACLELTLNCLHFFSLLLGTPSTDWTGHWRIESWKTTCVGSSCGWSLYW